MIVKDSHGTPVVQVMFTKLHRVVLVPTGKGTKEYHCIDTRCTILPMTDGKVDDGRDGTTVVVRHRPPDQYSKLYGKRIALKRCLFEYILYSLHTDRPWEEKEFRTIVWKEFKESIVDPIVSAQRRKG